MKSQKGEGFIDLLIIVLVVAAFTTISHGMGMAKESSRVVIDHDKLIYDGVLYEKVK